MRGGFCNEQDGKTRTRATGRRPPLLGSNGRGKGKTLSEFSPEEINSMVWSARLWLRNQPQTEYTEQVLLTQDARAEITRQAIEAEQTADFREGVGI